MSPITPSSPSFFLGCAVWAYRGFLGNLYPKGSRTQDFLSLYVDRLTAVEGNTTFYALPPEETVRKWQATMPPDFAFCPKLDRRITHEGNLLKSRRLSLNFLERMRCLGPNLGPILMQLPPSFGPAFYQDLKRYLTWWSGLGAELALEVRHHGWWQDEHANNLNAMLHDLGMARVLLDTRPIYSSDDDPQALNPRKKPRLPTHPVVTAPFTMIRFIAHPDAFYTMSYMSQWAEQVAQWLDEGTRVYFFSHCPVEEHSPGYARDFYKKLSHLHEPLAPLPWEHIAPPPKQLGLF